MEGRKFAARAAIEVFKEQDTGETFVISIPKEHKDFSEWFQAGLTKEQLDAIKQNQADYKMEGHKKVDIRPPTMTAIKFYLWDLLDRHLPEGIPLEKLNAELDEHVWPALRKRSELGRGEHLEFLKRPPWNITTKISNEKLKPGYEIGAGSVAEQVHKLRSRRGQFTEYELNKRVTDIILTDILKRGKFYTDTITGQAYLFFEEDKSLIEVSRENLDFCALLDSYNVACSDKMSIHIEEVFRLEARKTGLKTPIHRFCYYDDQKDTVYIAARQGCMYRISGEDCDLADVGTDGILILPEEGTEPVEISDVREEGLYEKVILDPVTFQTGVLTLEEQRILLDLYILSIIFASIMPPKPILTLVGEKGSRKSSTLRKIAKLFFGADEDVHLLPNKEDGFVNLVSNRHFVALDNVDTRCDWLDNLLAVSATGGKKSQRKLYTDNTMLTFPLRAFMALASRDPHFRRDDVADRLLILHLFKPEKAGIIPENEIAREVVEQRARLWRDFAGRIQEMIRALKAAKQHDRNKFTTPFRMGDFGTFAVKWAWFTEQEEKVRRILAKMTEEQVSFTVEEDILYSLFIGWIGMERNEGRVITGPDLCQELKAIAEKQNLEWPFKSTRSFGKNFARLVPSLKHEYTVDVEERRHVKTYLFYRRETVEEGKMQPESSHSSIG